jgi:[acyl-carrier-protein] S-malonyltransferase
MEVGGVATMVRFAAIFPGQGSQCVGMGCDIAENSRVARDLFARAGAVLGYDLLALQRNGPEERLRETQFSQPAIFVTNLALYYAAAGDAMPIVTAGHSFAELCSLVVAESLSFEEALRIVDQRGQAMQHAAELAHGGMSAVLGLEAPQVREVIARLHADTGGRISPANFNSPTQIVVSGDYATVQAAAQPMLDAGAKRVIPLNVSGAWHSELMEPAMQPLAAAMAPARFALPSVDVVANVDGQPYRDLATIERNIARSPVDEVRWHETALRLMEYQPEIVVEFGASNVLNALMRRMNADRSEAAPTLVTVSDWAGVEKFRALQRDAAETAV